MHYSANRFILKLVIRNVPILFAQRNRIKEKIVNSKDEWKLN